MRCAFSWRDQVPYDRPRITCIKCADSGLDIFVLIRNPLMLCHVLVPGGHHEGFHPKLGIVSALKDMPIIGSVPLT